MVKKSRVFRSSGLILLYLSHSHLNHLSNLLLDKRIILPAMGSQAICAVLNTILRISKITPTTVSQGIQRTVAEKAAKAFRICTRMTGKIFTLLMLKKIVVCHRIISFHRQISLI